jgi:hypothetical protein
MEMGGRPAFVGGVTDAVAAALEKRRSGVLSPVASAQELSGSALEMGTAWLTAISLLEVQHGRETVWAEGTPVSAVLRWPSELRGPRRWGIAALALLQRAGFAPKA